MKKTVLFLFFLVLFFNCQAKLIEVGSKDVFYSSPSVASIVLADSGFQPSFSVYSLGVLPVSLQTMDLRITTEKKGTALLIKHAIKPKAIIKSDWIPKDFLFSIDTNIQGNTGQFIEFSNIVDGNVFLNHWNYSDSNEIIFRLNNSFFGKSICGNSFCRDFSQEFSTGFVPYSASIANGIFSLKFSTTIASLSSDLNFFDLITLSKAVCNAPDSNVVWLNTNTYFLNVDGNVDVQDCNLEIQPGTVIKYKATVAGNSHLQITQKGVLKAQGTSANKIIFTSQNDCSVGATGTTDENCGTAKNRDYSIGIEYTSTAGITAGDGNTLSDLNIGYAKQGLYLSKGLDSIHDCNIHDNNSTTTGGSGVYIDVGSSITNFYNNTITNNTSTSGLGTGIRTRSAITNFYNNVISNNTSTTGSGTGVYNSHFITNFYNNIITYNTNAGNGAGIDIENNITNFYGNNLSYNTGTGSGGGAYIGGISISNFYNNTLSNNTANYGGAITTSKYTEITKFFNNTLSNNTANTVGGGAIYFYIDVIGSIYNNKFINNIAPNGQGGAINLSRDGAEIYNNLFKSNSAFSGGAIAIGVSGNNIYNNTFIDNNSLDLNCSAIDNNGTGVLTTSYNNIFAYNKGTAVCNMKGTITGNNNAFYASDKNTSGYIEGANSVYLGATPFIDDGSDRNFLLNSYGIQQLTGRGNSATGTNTFFQARTIRYDNRLDYNRTPGYHYDQNSPYLNLITNPIGNYSGIIPIDFNVSTSTSNLNTFSLLIKAINQFYDQNQTIYTGDTNNLCSGTYPSLTKDLNCKFNWQTNPCTLEDSNYSLLFNIADSNGAVQVFTNAIKIDNNICTPTACNATVNIAKGMVIGKEDYSWIIIMLFLIIAIPLGIILLKNAV